MLTMVPDPAGREGAGSPSLIDEIVREGARRMLAEARHAEAGAYIAAHGAERDENGRRLLVRNGYHNGREVLTRAGAIDVRVWAGLSRAFKLIEAAQDRWRAVEAPHLVALVRARGTITGGKLPGRPGEGARLAEPVAA